MSDNYWDFCKNISPTGINAVSTLSIMSTTSTTVPANGKIIITLPSVMSVSTSTSLVWTFIEPSSLGTVSWSYSGNVITAVLGSTSLPAGYFQINIAYVINPPSGTVTSSFLFETQNSSGTTLDSQSSGIVLQATSGSLTSVTLTPSSSVVGDTTTLTVAIKITNKVLAGGKVKVTFPKWNPNAVISSDIKSMIGSGFVVTEISNIQQSTLSAAFTSDVLTISSGFPSDVAAGSTISFTVTQFLNPITTQTTTGYSAQTTDSNDGGIDSSTATLKVSTPASWYSASIAAKDTTVVQEKAVLRLQFYSPAKFI